MTQLVKKAKVKSKTLWFHGISLAIGLTALAAGSETIAEKPWLAAVVIAIQGALGIALRFVTTQPIK
jgi:hypothetical protein